MNNSRPSTKRDFAIALLLASTAFCVGAIPAALTLMLLVKDSVFGWFIVAFVMSTMTFTLIGNLFDRKQVIEENRQALPVPKAWYRRHALLIGLVVGFIVTFLAAGLRLDIL